MDKSHVGHLVYHILPQNMPFYRDLFVFLGFKILFDDPAMLGLGDEHGTSIWFGGILRDVQNDYDGPGLNHLGLNVTSQGDVDEAVTYLRSKGIDALFETPRHRPEFTGNPKNTYYQVMFESPDRLLFEIVYIGPLGE